MHSGNISALEFLKFIAARNIQYYGIHAYPVYHTIWTSVASLQQIFMI